MDIYSNSQESQRDKEEAKEVRKSSGINSNSSRSIQNYSFASSGHLVSPTFIKKSGRLETGGDSPSQ